MTNPRKNSLSRALVAGVGMLMGCQAASPIGGNDAQQGTPVESANRSEALPRPTGLERRPLDDHEITPALKQKAEEILRDHADDPLGTEVPFELDGRRFVARLEEHFNALRGPHKGVTLFAALER